MSTLHKNLTGSDLHEPKGVDSATANQLYLSNGAGSGVWTSVGTIVASTKIVTVVASLPISPAIGDRAFVTDANATAFGSVVMGGGTNKVPVYYDGAWKIG